MVKWKFWEKEKTEPEVSVDSPTEIKMTGLPVTVNPTPEESMARNIARYEKAKKKIKELRTSTKEYKAWFIEYLKRKAAIEEYNFRRDN